MKKLCGFSFSINMAYFEAFRWNKKLSSNLFFLRSVIYISSVHLIRYPKYGFLDTWSQPKNGLKAYRTKLLIIFSLFFKAHLMIFQKVIVLQLEFHPINPIKRGKNEGELYFNLPNLKPHIPYSDITSRKTHELGYSSHMNHLEFSPNQIL